MPDRDSDGSVEREATDTSSSLSSSLFRGSSHQGLSCGQAIPWASAVLAASSAIGRGVRAAEPRSAAQLVQRWVRARGLAGYFRRKPVRTPRLVFSSARSWYAFRNLMIVWSSRKRRCETSDNKSSRRLSCTPRSLAL